MDNWFYVQDGNRVGPVSEEQLKTLHQAGAVEGETLIWRKGLKEWQAYDVVFPPPPGKKAADLVTEEKKAKAAGPPGKPPEKPGSAATPEKPGTPAGAPPAAAGNKPTPPPPPPEAYEQQKPADDAEANAKAKPEAPQGPADPKPAEGQQTSEAPTKLPKPISSKGSEKRWAGAGPTFSLAAGKRSEDEETEEEKDKDKDKDKDKAEKPEPAPSAKDQPDTADPERQEPREPAAERPTQPEPEPHADTGSNQTAAAAEAGSGKAREPLAAQDKPAQPAEASQPKVTPTLSENQELKPLKVAGEKSSGSGDLTIDGPVVERAICGECQKPFPVNMMDKYGRKWVCKLCQARLQEKYQQDKDRKKHKGGLFSGTMERIFLLLVVIGLLTAVGFSISGRLGRAIENVSNPFSIKPSLPAAEWVSLPPDEWPRIVMVNAGTFAESSPLRGGTGFLLRGAEDQVVGVTSSTLLSPDYGVYPPVHPASIPMVLANWKMVNPEEPQDLLRFTQTVGDPFSYLDTPVLFLQLENPTQTEFPVEVLRAQRGALKEQFVYVVTMQPRGDQFVQTVYSGTVFPSGGASKSLTVRLPEAVSDAEVPGAPILDANGHVVGMVVGSSPFQGHMPYEDFEQLSYAAQSGNRPMRRRRDVRVTITLYGVDLRAFPETVEY